MLPDDVGEILSDLAMSAIETGEVARYSTGLKVAFPIRKSPNDPVVGAVATYWTSAPFLATIGEYRRLQIFGAAIALGGLVLFSTIALRVMIAAPLGKIGARASDMAKGDLQTNVPCAGRKGEIGSLATSMESLRSNLFDAEQAAQAAFYESAGFRASSAAQLLCDEQFTITSTNAEFLGLLDKLGLQGLELSGASTNVFGVPELQKETLSKGSYPSRIGIWIMKAGPFLLRSKALSGMASFKGYCHRMAGHHQAKDSRKCSVGLGGRSSSPRFWC